ncbi:MAG TPA: agmatine deiminase family protein [Saprospiraceae bacterium]|nr:agmatine deiminase family protein [Saprospiraceae bacterium]
MRILYALFACLLLGGRLLAQVEPDLPRYPTADEKKRMKLPAPSSDLTVQSGITNPPSLPVRTMAEWEELQALVITWRSQPVILTEIVRAAREECRVIICCNIQDSITAAQTRLTNAGVDISSNVEFLLVPNNSIWVRDYGPNCVYANDVDSLYIVDWIYNRPARPLDNVLPEKIADYLDVPIYTTTVAPSDMVNTGGNFMSDGLGTAFASKLILDENDPGNPYGVSVKTESDINTIMHDFMGINRFIKMDILPYDEIHHIDMHMKLLDEETLLVGEYPAGTADGPQIEANIQYVLDNYKSVFGTPYKVIRIPMPPKNNQYPNSGADYRTYANAVFVNKTVILPFYEQKFDTTAQRIWKEALPGYKIVGVDCNKIIPSLGAIHCITKEIGVADPLLIVHQELPSCMENTEWPNGYPVWANLSHRSGIEAAKIYYATNPAGPWQSVDLPFYPLDDTTWSYKGYIPLQPDGSTVYYYIEGTSNSGKTLTRPLPAPEAWWSFCTKETTGTNEVPVARLLDIYPNPASAITVIPVSTTAKTVGNIRIFNTLGQYVETVFSGEFPSGPSNYFIDAGRFVSGTYFVELQTGGQTVLKKLVVQ